MAASAGLGGKESAGATDGAGVGVSGAAGGRFGLFSAINVGIPKNGQEDPLCQSGFLAKPMMFVRAGPRLVAELGHKTRWRRGKAPPVTVGTGRIISIAFAARAIKSALPAFAEATGAWRAFLPGLGDVDG